MPFPRLERSAGISVPSTSPPLCRKFESRPLTDSVNGLYSQRAMRFEWDPDKDADNRRKHGVSFREARGVLARDADCLEIYDEAHSDEEDRFIAIGKCKRGVLVVVYTEPEIKVL